MKVLSEGITVNCFGPSVVGEAMYLSFRVATALLTLGLPSEVTNLGPPAFFERLGKEGRLTPMKTVTDGIDIFINPKSKITGGSPFSLSPPSQSRRPDRRVDLTHPQAVSSRTAARRTSSARFRPS